MTVEELSKDLVLSARRVALSLCCKGPVGDLPRATFIGEAELIMLFASALLEYVVFSASFDYVTKNGRNVSSVELSGLMLAIEHAGDKEFNRGFVQIWRLSEKELRSQAALFKLMQAASGDYTEMKKFALRSCVDWALQRMNNGIITLDVTENLDRYGRIKTVFDVFDAQETFKINFSKLVIVGGVDRFDLQGLPASEQTYDVFISYRRIDGDVFARLINQEFEHRGLKCFLDVERIGRGEYRPQILSSLKGARNLVFAMTEMALVGLDNPEDSVRIELEAAHKLSKRIVIIVPPRVSRDMTYARLPSSLNYLKELNSYRLDVGENFESSLERVILRGLAD